jgi:hypothetical protein
VRQLKRKLILNTHIALKLGFAISAEVTVIRLGVSISPHVMAIDLAEAIELKSFY